jgi:hypothetical protein
LTLFIHHTPLYLPATSKKIAIISTNYTMAH